jgi:hypothetical protein
MIVVVKYPLRLFVMEHPARDLSRRMFAVSRGKSKIAPRATRLPPGDVSLAA